MEKITREKLEELIQKTDIFQYGFTDTKAIKCLPDVRKMCEANLCGMHGKTWACPPGVGTLEQCEQQIKRYRHMLVFSVKYDLEDSFDYEGMMDGMERFKETCRSLHEAVSGYLSDYMILANEGCQLCAECTYPSAPCRFPDRVHGSLESYGIMVSDLARLAHMNYINGANTVTYLGGMAFNGDASF